MTVIIHVSLGMQLSALTSEVEVGGVAFQFE